MRSGHSRANWFGAGKIRRPTRPLSGLVVCGCCGHAMTMLGRDRYGCQVHKEQGESRCTNGRTAAAADVESRVLDGLRAHLCRPDRIERFARAYVEERQRLRASTSGRTSAIEQELATMAREETQIAATIGRVDPAIVDGMVARLNAMAARKRELQAELDALPARDEVIDITRISADYLSRNLTRLWGGADRAKRRRFGVTGPAGADQPHRHASGIGTGPLPPRDRGRCGRVHGSRRAGRGLFAEGDGCGDTQLPIPTFVSSPYLKDGVG